MGILLESSSLQMPGYTRWAYPETFAVVDLGGEVALDAIWAYREYGTPSLTFSAGLSRPALPCPALPVTLHPLLYTHPPAPPDPASLPRVLAGHANVLVVGIACHFLHLQVLHRLRRSQRRGLSTHPSNGHRKPGKALIFLDRRASAT